MTSNRRTGAVTLAVAVLAAIIGWETGWGQRAMQVARQMFVKATGIDPRYARAYAAIANCDSYLLCMGDPAVSAA